MDGIRKMLDKLEAEGSRPVGTIFINPEGKIGVHFCCSPSEAMRVQAMIGSSRTGTTYMGNDYFEARGEDPVQAPEEKKLII